MAPFSAFAPTLHFTRQCAVDSGKFANIGFTIFNDDNEYLAFLLNANDSGYNLHLEGTGFTAVNVTVADSTDVTMRVSWDAVAKTLTSAYSFDGSSFTDVNSFNPLTGAGVTGSGWSNTTNPVSNGFNLGITGNSDAAGAISVGSIYADNFSVSAVPEPSTYAAIFGGLVLGLAIWRRRQAA